MATDCIFVRKSGDNIRNTLLGFNYYRRTNLPHTVFAVIGGIICDLITRQKQTDGPCGYKDICISEFLGTVIPVIYFRDQPARGRSIEMEK